MPEHLSPGVYSESVPSSNQIEGVGTAVAAFVGFAEQGPTNEPVRVTDWTQYTQTFGGFASGAYLAHCVYGYFLNGGGEAYIVRLGAGDIDGAGRSAIDAGERSGLAALEAIEEVTMLCVPDLMSAHQSGMIDDEGLRSVQQAMIAHCERMQYRVALLDAPPGLTLQQVHRWRVEDAGYDSKYAALYWPWLRVTDPTSDATIDVPPSGHIAGVWARSDDTRGVHKAPANEVVRGVVDTPSPFTRGEHDKLNPVGVNCIRSSSEQGVRVWGARTLSSDPEWRYLNVRRLFNFVEKSILDGTQWVVLEPNDQFLWGKVVRNVNLFLRRVWRSGALVGATPEEAFHVKCDAENNPPENRDAGTLTVDVGIAAVRPSEFIIVRLSLRTDGAALEE